LFGFGTPRDRGMEGPRQRMIEGTQLQEKLIRVEKKIARGGEGKPLGTKFVDPHSGHAETNSGRKECISDHSDKRLASQPLKFGEGGVSAMSRATPSSRVGGRRKGQTHW